MSLSLRPTTHVHQPLLKDGPGSAPLPEPPPVFGRFHLFGVFEGGLHQKAHGCPRRSSRWSTVVCDECCRPGHQVVNGAGGAGRRGSHCCCVVRARERSGAGTRRVGLDGAPHSSDGGRSHLCEFRWCCWTRRGEVSGARGGSRPTSPTAWAWHDRRRLVSPQRRGSAGCGSRIGPAEHRQYRHSPLPRSRAGQIPALPGLRMPLGSRASLIFSLNRRCALSLNE